MVAFIDTHREHYGVEPMCELLPIAPSTYYAHKARKRDPSRHCARFHSDEALKPEIERVWHENLQVYGARKVWKQLQSRVDTDSALHRGASDESAWTTRSGAWQVVQDNDL